MAQEKPPAAQPPPQKINRPLRSVDQLSRKQAANAPIAKLFESTGPPNRAAQIRQAATQSPAQRQAAPPPQNVQQSEIDPATLKQHKYNPPDHIPHRRVTPGPSLVSGPVRISRPAVVQSPPAHQPPVDTTVQAENQRIAFSMKRDPSVDLNVIRPTEKLMNTAAAPNRADQIKAVMDKGRIAAIKRDAARRDLNNRNQQTQGRKGQD